MYKHTILSFIFLFSSALASAQYMKRNGEFSDAVEGDALFSLVDSTFIYTEMEEPLWYKGSKRVVFNIDDMNADSTLKPGAKLFDSDLNEIGEIIRTTEVKEVFDLGGFRRGDYRTGILEGYVSSFEFHAGSRPENALMDAMNNTRGNAGRLIVPVIEEFPFENESVNGYNVFVLRDYDQHNSEYNEYPFRILIVMRGSSSLICIITQTEMIESSSAKETSEDFGRNFTWFQRKNDRLAEDMESLMYKFLPI
ncbi:hypothetical protein [Phaeocystidibacter luteus]|uniref:Uncharacterized protein n=1 Tax=Phaeocystidibacter luteus TaxID=911197 RepID=A0A6N6RCQ8_9FLAO|nr:hypothetical protein [Phaeocystidibacter luteus]KAB2805415.1 hypothetical protein F8C67_13865 [Phaeocystidibacter luteus]